MSENQRDVDGRPVVNRAWIGERAEVSGETVKSWFRSASAVAPPSAVATIDRVQFYDLTDVERFLAERQQAKRASVLPTDPELHQGDEDDLIDINTAAKWFGFSGPSVIRSYLRHNPGYFPAPAGEVEGPSGRMIRAFRRGDLIAFDKKRDGDNTGVAGRPPGSPGPTAGRRSPDVLRRIALARQYMEQIGGWHRGIAVELAQQTDEPVSRWHRAVREARQELSSSDTP
ncbi:hypothetical protein [Streptomyces sp. 891-h]|uniref:hypothetical protein n=1 Tax=Streptomyces sp. 891-h TaxID=2720714 RepID=UPI001FAA521F|nr:hypothetical protein [Streptomyces sp. 891-h]UNZ21408.1 hypothetical protein HC362_34510 [Streptomyces sp. 891-h]